MDSELKNELILCSIKSHKEIKKSTVAVNFIANLFLSSATGRIADDFIISLTKDNLYIEAYWYTTWGGLPDKLYTEKFSRNQIQEFEVRNEEGNEIIEITPYGKKKMVFIRYNKDGDNLGELMKKLFHEEF